MKTSQFDLKTTINQQYWFDYMANYNFIVKNSNNLRH